MIRLATLDDVQMLLAMGERFLAASPFARVVGLDADELSSALSRLIEAPDSIVLVAESTGETVGALAGLLAPAWFRPSARMAVELAWWMSEAHRRGTAGIRLLRAFEHWATAQGAAFVVASDLLADGEPTIGDMLTRLGYSAVERAHIKVEN